MELVVRNLKIEAAWLAMAEAYNESPKDSEQERLADARMSGFREACKILGQELGYAIMEADLAMMEKHGEVPMCGGCLFKS